MRALFLCIFIAVLAVTCSAAGKQTVDPNQYRTTSGNAVSLPVQPGDMWSDTRLSKTITSSSNGQTLHHVVDELQNASGVSIRAGQNVHDWQVRGLRLNVAAKDVPLKDLMQSIARVLGLRWIRRFDGSQYTYRLLGEPLPAGTSTEERKAEESRERRQKFFSRYLNLAHMSSSQIDRLQVTNPSLYDLSRHPLGIPLAKVLAKAPMASTALTEGREFHLTASDLPVAARNELLAAMLASAEQDTDQAGAGPAVSPNLDSICLDINSSDSSADPGMGTVEISYEGGKQSMTFPDTKPQRKTAVSSVDDDEPGVNQADADEPVHYQPDPVVSQPDEPDLRKKMRLSVSQSRVALDIAQAALAEASGFAVVSDAYEEDAAKVDMPGKELELKDWLQLLTQASERNWWKQGTVVEIKDRNWAAKREKRFRQQTHSDPTPEYQ